MDEPERALHRYLEGEDDVLPDVDDEPVDQPIPPVADLDETRITRYLYARKHRVEERAAIVAAADAQIAAIVAWRDKQVKPFDRSIRWFETTIEGWMRAINRDQPSRFSKRLVPGTLKLNPTHTHVEVTDKAAAVEFCGQADRLDLLAFDVSKSAITAAVKAGTIVEKVRELKPGDEVIVTELLVDGAVIPGVTIQEPAVRKFTIA